MKGRDEVTEARRVRAELRQTRRVLQAIARQLTPKRMESAPHDRVDEAYRLAMGELERLKDGPAAPDVPPQVERNLAKLDELAALGAIDHARIQTNHQRLLAIEKRVATLELARGILGVSK